MEMSVKPQIDGNSDQQSWLLLVYENCNDKIMINEDLIRKNVRFLTQHSDKLLYVPSQLELHNLL